MYYSPSMHFFDNDDEKMIIAFFGNGINYYFTLLLFMHILTYKTTFRYTTAHHRTWNITSKYTRGNSSTISMNSFVKTLSGKHLLLQLLLHVNASFQVQLNAIECITYCSNKQDPCKTNFEHETLRYWAMNAPDSVDISTIWNPFLIMPINW